MSDFETFDADLGNNEIPEQDPAADFIQREQDALAKIENPEVGLNDFVAPDFPNGNYISIEILLSEYRTKIYCSHILIFKLTEC